MLQGHVRVRLLVLFCPKNCALCDVISPNNRDCSIHRTKNQANTHERQLSSDQKPWSFVLYRGFIILPSYISGLFHKPLV